MYGAGAYGYSALSKRPSLTVSLAALPIVERSDQWPGPLDHTVTMLAVEGALSCCQYLAPLNSRVLVVSEWPSLEVAVTLPGVRLGSMLIV
jgi:hypothetical protein